jgi:ribulose-phosphate 3-epimerase
MNHIAPSILSADFSRLGEQVQDVERAGAGRIHVDVMDGHFVPNLSMGPIVVEGLRPATRLPLEVHLMVEDPAKFIPAFLKTGADSVIFHLEVVPQPQALIESVKALGKRVGVSINPDKSVALFEPWLKAIDTALLMTVFPGFGGQAYLEGNGQRIRDLRRLINAINPACELEVDGGVHLGNARQAADDGANVFVVGNGLFKHPKGHVAAVRELREILDASADRASSASRAP